MALTVLGILFLHLLVVGRHPTIAENDTVSTNECDGHGSCLFRNCIIGPTFKRAANCSKLTLDYVNITELSKEQFDRITEGLILLNMRAVILGSMSLPTDLVNLFLMAKPGYASPHVTIDANSNYKLETITLYNLPQLPVNFEKLHSLTDFICQRIYGRKVEFTEFTRMLQLELIFIDKSAGVTLTDSLALSSLKTLNIFSTPMTVSDVALCKFPKLETFDLSDNNLQVITAFDLSTFTNVRFFRFTNNKLRRVILDAFANMTQLKILDLTANEITEIIIQNRIEFPNLKTLSLLYNNLTVLNFNQWSIPALENLGLSGNLLQRVPGLLQLPTAKLQSLEMNDNPWDCEWLVETVMQIPGMKIFDQKGFCYAYGSARWNF